MYRSACSTVPQKRARPRESETIAIAAAGTSGPGRTPGGVSFWWDTILDGNADRTELWSMIAGRPEIRDEPLSHLALETLEVLGRGPATKEGLKAQFGEHYWADGIKPLLRYGLADFPIVERLADSYRVGPLEFMPERMRSRIRLITTYRTEYFGGSMGAVAGAGTVWNAWRLPADRAGLYRAEPGSCNVTIWNQHGEDDFFLKEGVDFEVVPWSTPLLHGIDPVDVAVPAFDAITASLQIVDRELVSYLSRHPDQMYELTPRKFEELAALLLSDMGYEVQLTPETRDRGRDILAVLRVPPGKDLLLIVECKRLARSRKVGIDIVQRFLWILDYQDKANGGLIATTSSFSSEARRLAANHRWRLELCEFDGLQHWLAQFGKWTRTDRSGIWLPS